MKIINDTHLGVSRQSGTTPESRRALAEFQLSQFEAELNTNDSVMILGDLFDKANVDLSVVWRTFKILSDYLEENTKKHFVYLVKGNHDASNTWGKMCSLDLLAEMLDKFHPDSTVYITEPYDLSPTVRVIPHLPNQDTFDLEIKRADEEGVCTLLLHCNYDNPFAADKDHSLNITKEQASLFGCLIIAHEHTLRDIDLGNTLVHVLGCQAPTSVADCKNSDRFTSTTFDPRSGCIDRTEVLDIGSLYSEIDWQELDEEQAVLFIRITGNATAEQAGKATQAVSKFRKKSNAYVITNAIKIEGLTSEEDLEHATEEISSLNITQLLYDQLKPWQVSAIKKFQGDEVVSLAEESRNVK